MAPSPLCLPYVLHADLAAKPRPSATALGETTFIRNVPDAAKDKIMHVQLPITESFHLMGSDTVEGFGPVDARPARDATLDSNRVTDCFEKIPR